MKNILFKISGSIAAYKSCYLISKLVQSKFNIKVVCSRSALHFIGEATLEGLTGNQVYKDVFESGQMMQHIYLAKWADIVVLCPATANTINKLAIGSGDDLITTLFLAHDFSKPYIVVPAMNSQMYIHPRTQKSLETLEEWGVRVLETDSGPLACGDVGDGRLLDPEVIFKEIEGLGNKKKNSLGSVLMTSGGTRESIDGVRYISNGSTGRTAGKIAESLMRVGFDIVFLYGKGSLVPEGVGKAVEYTSTQDLDEKIKTILAEDNFEAIVHSAAVSDYHVSEIQSGKRTYKPNKGIKISSKEDLTLKLQKNPKIVDKIKGYVKKGDPLLISFKLTNGAQAKEAAELIGDLQARSGSDYVVYNDLSGISANRHLAKIYQGCQVIAQTTTNEELALEIEKLILNKKIKSNDYVADVKELV